MEGLAVNPAFWRGRRVLVTGHTGFKGSWLSLWLQRMGAEVVGFALPPESDRGLYRLAGVADALTSVEGDLRDADHVRAVIAQHRPEVVFHLAAQALVRRSFDHPVETYATNVLGTVHLLEAVRREPGARAVVCVTSDKCYENRETERPYVEDDPMGGVDPYSSSKGCAELVAAAYRRSYFPPSEGVAVSTARAGNVIGGGDWAADRLVVDVIRACLEGASPIIRNPSAVRPWQFVLEPLVGYLTLAERSWAAPVPTARAWNFGPELADCQSVGWLVERIARAWGTRTGWTPDRRPQPHEARLLLLDAGLARRELGWQPRLGLEEAVDWTVDWYRTYAAGGDLRALTLDQIDRFQARAAA
jgi:CDP-glucose 4,6-dehydratase